jgi:hypothetical protein
MLFAALILPTQTSLISLIPNQYLIPVHLTNRASFGILKDPSARLTIYYYSKNHLNRKNINFVGYLSSKGCLQKPKILLMAFETIEIELDHGNETSCSNNWYWKGWDHIFGRTLYTSRTGNRFQYR